MNADNWNVIQDKALPVSKASTQKDLFGTHYFGKKNLLKGLSHFNAHVLLPWEEKRRLKIRFLPAEPAPLEHFIV